MSALYVSLAFLLLGALCLGREGRAWRAAAVAVVGCAIAWQNGMRDWQRMANDTLAYYQTYEEVKTKTWKELAAGVKLETEKYNERDQGFLLFVKATQAACPRFRFLLIVVALMITSPICWLLWRFAPSASGVFLAGIVYEALFAGFFMTAMRQTVAMGIALWALAPLLRRQYAAHYLLLAPACLIHTIALAYLPLGPLLAAKRPRWALLASLCLLPVLMEAAPPLLRWAGQGTIMAGYAVNSADNLGTPVFSAALIALAAALAWKGKAFLGQYNGGALLMVSAALAVTAMPASWVDSNFIRVAFCYLIVLLPVAPMLIGVYGRPRLLYFLIGIGLIGLKWL